MASNGSTSSGIAVSAPSSGSAGSGNSGAGGTSPSGSGNGGGGQHYSLRWNNHQSHVLSAFDALLQNESLVDCTLVCEDANVKAHRVVLSACSPYFQKIFLENPCKHPVIVLKDIRGWEVQCIVDFMYKGETSVPEAQLTGLIKAAESLKVRGLTSSDQQLPQGLTLEATSNGYHRRSYSPYEKMARSHSSQSSPMSLTNHDQPAGSGPNGSGSSASAAAPRRKQARPRRRSGDSIGNASLDLSKADSPPSLHAFRKSPTGANGSAGSHMDVDAAPENLSLKRPSSSPAINLVSLKISCYLCASITAFDFDCAANFLPTFRIEHVGVLLR